MLTIAGTGMSNYSVRELAEKLDFNSFDYIVADKNYLINDDNTACWPLESSKMISGHFKEYRDWIRKTVKANRKVSILYIVTGSPTFYSGGMGVLKCLGKEIKGFDRYTEVKIIGNVSCKDYLLTRLGIEDKEVSVLSMHGKDFPDLRKFMTTKYTLILSDSLTLLRMKQILCYLDIYDYQIMLASKLGYAGESIIYINDIDLFLNQSDLRKLMPYVLLIEKKYSHSHTLTGDDEFEQDKGMISKSFKRGICFHELELKPNLLLWDIGAATGSVGIDAYKLYQVRPLFFEKNSKRCGDLVRNLYRHRVVGTKIVEGDALQTTKNEYQNPDRIFIGGGGREIAANILSLYDRLKPGGILLAHYVTLNHMLKAIESLQKDNVQVSVRSISLTNYKDQELLLAEPERLLFQIKARKPEDS